MKLLIVTTMVLMAIFSVAKANGIEDGKMKLLSKIKFFYQI